MYFALSEEFFPSSEAVPRPVTVRVVYLDRGHGRWALKYDALDDPAKVARTVTNGDSGRWKTLSVALPDARLRHRGPEGADLILVDLDRSDAIFHWIEVSRDP